MIFSPADDGGLQTFVAAPAFLEDAVDSGTDTEFFCRAARGMNIARAGAMRFR